MFNSQFGSQISWLLPAALISLLAGLIVTARRTRTDRTRAALMMWGGWLLLTGVIFSLGKGIIHEYYSVALAPAIAVLCGMGISLAIEYRDRWAARLVTSAAIVATAASGVALLLRTADWNPWLRTLVAVCGGVGAVGYLFYGKRVALARAAAALALVAVLAGPVSYSVSTAGSSHTGSLPTAGPATGRDRNGGPGGAGGFGGFGGPGVGNPPSATTPGGPLNTAAVGPLATGAGGPGGGAGGLLNASTADTELVAALEADASSYRWVAAAVGANSAAGYQLATDLPVFAIGGFNGSDPSPTLEEFKVLVANRSIHYFIAGGMGFGGQQGGSDASSSISAWVSANFTAQTIGGTTVYDLTVTG